MPISTRHAARTRAGRPAPGDTSPPGSLPSDDETEFLALLNRARANPALYGRRTGIDLSGVRPSWPLVMEARLVAAARSHSEDMADRNYFDHRTPGGEDPGRQMSDAGFHWQTWGQSIAAGFRTPADALETLVRDEGVPDLAHRRHLLSIDGVFAGQDLVGVGVARGGSFGVYYTVNTASAGGRVARTPEPREADFVRLAFEGMAGRPPSGDEAAEWLATALTPGGLPAATLQMARSQEVREAQVYGWYAAYLGRRPTSSELKFFTNALRVRVPEEDVITRLVSGKEYAAAAARRRPGTPEDEAWLAAAFRTLTGRDPYPEELRSGVEKLPYEGRSGIVSSMLWARECRLKFLADESARFGGSVAGDEAEALHHAGQPFTELRVEVALRVLSDAALTPQIFPDIMSPVAG